MKNLFNNVDIEEFQTNSSISTLYSLPICKEQKWKMVFISKICNYTPTQTKYFLQQLHKTTSERTVEATFTVVWVAIATLYKKLLGKVHIKLPWTIQHISLSAHKESYLRSRTMVLRWNNYYFRFTFSSRLIKMYQMSFRFCQKFQILKIFPRKSISDWNPILRSPFGNNIYFLILIFIRWWIQSLPKAEIKLNLLQFIWFFFLLELMLYLRILNFCFPTLNFIKVWKVVWIFWIRMVEVCNLSD